MDEELLSVLRCPLTLSALKPEGDELVAEKGGLRYPVRDGLPVLLVEEAKLPQGVGSLREFVAKFRDLIPPGRDLPAEKPEG